MGLKMPFAEDDWELSEMGLKMPSKVGDDFIRGLFMRDSCSCCLRRSPLGKVDFCCSPAWGKLCGRIESRNLSCPWLYWGVISGLKRWMLVVFWLKSRLHSNLLGRMKLIVIWKCIIRSLCRDASGWVRVKLHLDIVRRNLCKIASGWVSVKLHLEIY